MHKIATILITIRKKQLQYSILTENLAIFFSFDFDDYFQFNFNHVFVNVNYQFSIVVYFLHVINSSLLIVVILEPNIQFLAPTKINFSKKLMNNRLI